MPCTRASNFVKNPNFPEDINLPNKEHLRVPLKNMQVHNNWCSMIHAFLVRLSDTLKRVSKERTDGTENLVSSIVFFVLSSDPCFIC